MIIAIYFCKQLIQVMDYDDPQISSYEIMEDRSHMEKPLVLGDSKLDFVVGFVNLAFETVEIDSRYGKLELYHHSSELTNG